MCGILAIFGFQNEAACQAFRQTAVALAKKLRHRGPDWSGLWCEGVNIIAHERLAIVDPDSGDQPLLDESKRLVLGVNGEIYNHMELAEPLRQKHKFLTKSDCEVLLHLYAEHGEDFLCQARVLGMFAFVLYDKKTDTFLAARDYLGIMPLYIGWGRDGTIWFASELKALQDNCERFEAFPPGHVYNSKTGSTTRWYNAAWMNPSPHPTKSITPGDLRRALEKSVVSHLMSDVPYGVLLSGGLDSSSVASLMARHCAMRIESGEREQAHWPRLHSFSIGLEGSPDLAHARKVADHLGTVHHEYHFTVQQGIDALDDVIYHLETFDTTTIRAATPMYLMARKIRATGVKMVLSGEGADEVFGGYLYFHKAPNETEFHDESVRKVLQLHYYDLLRANKSMMAWGVEARVPFLDREFLEFAMSIDVQQKMCGIKNGRIEKHLVRQAFDVRMDDEKICETVPPKDQAPTREQGEAYLPASVLWRQKEQFSDGVGYSWIDGLRDYAEQKVSDSQMKQAANRFPTSTPNSKESYLYRTMFAKHFPSASAVATVKWQDSIACSSAAALKWDAAFQGRADPSGRAVLGVHASAY